MTADRDDLDDLKAAIRTAAPRPDPEKRAADLALAREAFDALQGSRAGPRQTPVAARKGFLTGVTTMLSNLTSPRGLATTTALVACGFLFLTPAGQSVLRPSGPVDVGRAIGGENENLQATEFRERSSDGELALVDEAAPVAVQEEAATRTEIGAEADANAPQAPQMQARTVAPEAEFADDGVDLRGQSSVAELVSPVAPADRVAPIEPNTEAFPEFDRGSLKVTSEEPVSTFSIDVDTAAYSVIRSSLTQGALPPSAAVRIEEMINYFPYDYPAPDGPHPFATDVAVMETPWNDATRLVRIGIQGELPAIGDRPPLNLVFLVDSSGSMDDPRKLPLLVQSFGLMLSELRPGDEVAIVAYAGSSGLVLPPTAARDAATIRAALGRLRAGGSTNGQGGLEQAYAVAEEMAADGEISRVILATDGDFNVGLSDPGALEDFIAEKRDTGTYLSVLGFGRGNLDDATMQALAQNGNGTAAYIDTLSEAQKVLVDQLTGALFPIANDVKIQVEFNPAAVAEYRLIGYETRALRREDFNNDAIDAGELGAGHSVTALYEVTPVGSPARLTDPLRYAPVTAEADSDELGFLRLRYKRPGNAVSELIETPIATDAGSGSEAGFAAAIAGFGQLLTGSDYLGDWGWDEAIALANANRGEDPFGYRTEAVQLMRLAQSLSAR